MKQYEHKKSFDLENVNWWFLGMQSAYEELVKMCSLSSKETKVLDVGCGTGQNITILKKYAGKVSGVDISPEAINFCVQRGLDNVFVSDAARLEFPDGSFDLVTAFMIIEHVEDDLGFLKELNRLIKPGGKAVISTSAFNFLWSEHDEASEHKRRYTVRGLKERISEAGFSINKISYFNFLLFLPFLPVVLVKNIFGGKKKDRQERMLFNLPSIATKMLVALIKLEAILLKYISFPFGVNIVCIIEKNKK